MKSEFKDRATDSINGVISDIALRVESIMDYINGSKGIESEGYFGNRKCGY